MNIQEQLELNALFEDVAPEATKKVAAVIGRFSPPTKGHYAVIDQVKKFIRTNKKLGLEASPVVVIIGGGKSDADKKRNPLSVDERELFMKNSGNANGVLFFTATNAFAALSMLREKGFEPIAIAAGSDRLDDYVRILDKHFLTNDGKPIKHHKILLQRDDDAVATRADEKEKGLEYAYTHLKETGKIDIKHVSGSLARYCVTKNDPASFAIVTGLEGNMALAKKMFNKIAAAMKE
jgi:hypothetical protein